jgi:glycogen debranching enzyme
MMTAEHLASTREARLSKDRRPQHVTTFLLLLCALGGHSGPLLADTQTDPDSASVKLAWSTDSVGPARFVSVHGRRAAVFGYSEDGLEVWAYPFQILSSFKLSFGAQGTTTAIDGQSLLRRIIYSPEAVTRIYAGPDFIVREKIFVPLEEPGAIIRYEVASPHPVDIVIRFMPVLDLMWPGGIGGQDAAWNSAASAYVFSEQRHRFSGSIGSPDIVAHDDTPNQSRDLGRESGLAFTIRAGGDHTDARVVIAGGPERSATAIAQELLGNDDSLERIVSDHYSALLNTSLQIEAPDEATNRALAWSEIALDQAWVCNPDLGCGLAAGYGPSRRARRPQYDWFFAGDGMVDLPALLAAGQYERARQELEFILKYQDQKTGMIWHELSQSAGWIDWSKYPYMFVHVELTFDFLDATRNYFVATGDRSFVEAHWAAIQSAYQYCRTLVNLKDGLPRIPAGKEGSREQEALSEELALSASWIRASQAYASLAAATGHTADAAEASAISRQTRDVVARRYWDEKQNFWITGYTRSGAPLIDRQIGPVSILGQGIFSERQRDSIIQQLASSDFETDWGTRGRASSSSTYDPTSYANGSVWAISTSWVATAFWAAHQPATAFPIWNALVPWSSLDSLGHMHETVAGDYYHEEFESVPEQTWSSATFFVAAVNGLLGLQVDGASNHVKFAPHLPPSWDALTIRNLHVGSSEINFKLSTSTNEMRLQMHNEGGPVKVLFDPEIPFGAKLRSAHLQNHPIAATLDPHSQDTHAKVVFDLSHGDALLTLEYTGGVAILPESPPIIIGAPSKGIKITKVNLHGQLLTIDFDYLPLTTTVFDLRTPWVIKEVQGATFQATSRGWYRVTVTVPPQAKSKPTYQNGEIKVTFAGNASA